MMIIKNFTYTHFLFGLAMNKRLFSYSSYLKVDDKSDKDRNIDTSSIIEVDEEEEDNNTSDIIEVDNEEEEDKETTDFENNNDVYLKKTVYKNDLRKQVLKQSFDNKVFGQKNVFTGRDKLLQERVDVHDEHKQLSHDLKSADGAMKAAIDMSIGRIPKKKDFDSYRQTTENYNSFFDQDPIENQTQILDVKHYISEELKVNEARAKILKEKCNTKSDVRPLKRKLDDVSDTEESERSTKSMSIDKESPKSMSVDLESPKSISEHAESEKNSSQLPESDKVNRQSVQSSGTPSDYIDSLPVDHNPFDDIGSD